MTNPPKRNLQYIENHLGEKGLATFLFDISEFRAWMALNSLHESQTIRAIHFIISTYNKNQKYKSKEI